MSSESIPVGLRSLLAKHYFLAQITSGQKPCMSNMTLIDASSWTGALYRFWYGESRKTGMADIENIISQTIDAITTHKHKPAFLRLIINALASTRVGLESMTTTYRNDPAMIGRLRVQLTNIDLQLGEHRDLIKGYRNQEPDEKIINAVVQGTDTNDKEGLRNFLMGKTSPVNVVPPVRAPSIDENNNDNDNDNVVPNRSGRDRDADRLRRRRHRVKQTAEETSESHE